MLLFKSLFSVVNVADGRSGILAGNMFQMSPSAGEGEGSLPGQMAPSEGDGERSLPGQVNYGLESETENADPAGNFFIT